MYCARGRVKHTLKRISEALQFAIWSRSAIRKINDRMNRAFRAANKAPNVQVSVSIDCRGLIHYFAYKLLRAAMYCARRRVPNGLEYIQHESRAVNSLSRRI